VPNIILPRQHTAQPQGRVELLPDLFGVPLLVSYDPGVRDSDLDFVGGAASPGALGLYRSMASGQYATADDAPLAPITNACTWVWRGVWVSGSNFLFGHAFPGGSLYAAGIYTSGSNFPVFYVRTGSVVAAQQSVALVSGAEITLVGTYDGATVRLFRDGVLVASASQSGNVSAGSGTHITFNRWNTFSPASTRALFGRVFGGALSADQVRELTANPWMVFQDDPEVLYFDVPAGVETTTADGTPDAVSLTAPTGAAAVSVAASGALDLVTLTAPTGAAAVSVTAAGAVAPLSLSAPTGAAAVEVAAAGALDAVTLTAPTGTADTVSTVVAAGAVAPLSLSAPTGAAAVEVAAAGAIDAFSLTAPTGTASTVSTVVAAGAVAPLSLTAPTGAAAVEVAASGAIYAVTLTAPNGAAGTVTTVVAAGALAPLSLSAPVGAADVAVAVAGLISEITLSAPTGNASTGATVTAAGAIAPVSLTPPNGAHAVSVAAFGDVRRLQLVPPTGSASDGSVSYLPRPGFTVGASIRRRFDA